MTNMDDIDGKIADILACLMDASIEEVNSVKLKDLLESCKANAIVLYEIIKVIEKRLENKSDINSSRPANTTVH